MQIASGTSLLAAVGLWLVTPLTLAAQCDAQWLTPGGVPGTNGRVRCLAYWDPDGPGPRGLCPVVGGQFKLAGDSAALGVAIWEDGAWHALGAGLTGDIYALVVMPNNELVAGGYVTVGSSRGVARFDGTAWQPMGGGVGSSTDNVRCLCVQPDGTLVAGGDFSGKLNIAKWNGATWDQIGAGVNSAVYGCAYVEGYGLIIGGGFATSGGAPVSRVARWTGAVWEQLAQACRDKW
ncbi:MAG: hypothetical protein QM783_14545 [Phycisphaerales bacterium]